MIFEKGVIIVGVPSVLKILYHIPALFIITNSDCCVIIRRICVSNVSIRKPIYKTNDTKESYSI